MPLDTPKIRDKVSYKVDNKSGKFICLECEELMVVAKVVDERLVCEDCAKKLKEKKQPD